MRETASSNSRLPTSTPSTRLMTSPGSTPARAAGEPSIGEMITSRFLRFSTSMPMPLNLLVPLGLLLEAVVLLGVHEARVWIEHVGEPARRAVHQLGLGDVLDVVGLDVREHLREDAELLIGVEPPRERWPGENHTARKAATTSNAVSPMRLADMSREHKPQAESRPSVLTLEPRSSLAHDLSPVLVLVLVAVLAPPQSPGSPQPQAIPTHPRPRPRRPNKHTLPRAPADRAASRPDRPPHRPPHSPASAPLSPASPTSTAASASRAPASTEESGGAVVRPVSITGGASPLCPSAGGPSAPPRSTTVSPPPLSNPGASGVIIASGPGPASGGNPQSRGENTQPTPGWQLSIVQSLLSSQTSGPPD